MRVPSGDSDGASMKGNCAKAAAGGGPALLGGDTGFASGDGATGLVSCADTAVMGEVMELRLTDQLREAQGATYSPSVTYNHSLTWTGWGYLSASVEVPAAKLDGVMADIDKIAADLKAKEPTPDELARAKKPRLDQLERARLTNQYWLNELSNAQSDPRKLDFIRQIIPGTERVSAADVQRAAATWLDAGKAYRVVVKPK